MNRVTAFLRILNDHEADLPGEHPADDALRRLIVHAAWADGCVDESEFDLVSRLFPGRSNGEILEWIADETGHPMDFQALADALPSQDEREEALMLAGHTAWEDDDLHQHEVGFLGDLMRALGLDPGDEE